ncbi:hypothetical protein [uncultured Salegentibacter sp.]|uniref:hypothetical protein n=1 Tax=uncultured Salegentibacter sp. TaxID=259320 RepID=UPI002595EBEC|nr:hypothetical protein [uncultured Salegentibacter sp.]
MRKIFWVLGLSFLAFACSIEREELDWENLKTANFTTSIEGCIVHRYNLGVEAQVEVRNYYNNLIVMVSASNDKSLNQINLHFSENVEGFPTNKKSKFLLGQMDYKNIYPEGTFYEEFKIPLSELPEEFLMVVYTEFGSGNDKDSAWAGDLSLDEAGWNYFEYQVLDFPFYAGTDQMQEITISEAQAIGSWNEVRKLYANMLDEGVDKSQWYAYNPSLNEIIADFNDPERESQLGDYTTTYTLGTGECSDSVDLTLRIVAD